MLSALTKSAARAWNVPQADDCSTAQDEDLFYVNVEVCDLLIPLPEFPWARVADMCVRTVTPMYRTIRNTLHDDMEQLAFILAEQNPSRIEDADAKTPVPDAPSSGSEYEVVRARLSPPERPSRKRRRSSAVDMKATVVIPAANPSIPTIVITLCPSQPRESACLVPYQDASFGNRLVVPTHHTFNDVFPPLVAKPRPFVEHWRYENGHWWAQLPDLEEQVTKGLFSRPLSTRRRRACVDRSSNCGASR